MSAPCSDRRKLRAAILGYGRSGGSLHAGAIEESDAFELVAACDIDAACRERAAARFRCSVYDDYRAMLEREDLDLVCVVTRSDQHCAMACDVMEAGRNVLVTKPWAVDVGEARRMTACARKAGVQLLPWLPARWGSDLRRLNELVEGGTIGDVFLVRRIVSSFATRSDWQTERRYGGGYLLNWGPHIVDPPLRLMKERAVSVYGRMRRIINPGDAEDLFMAVITLESGALIQCEYTISPVKHPSWVLQGTEGVIVVEDRTLRIHRQRPGQPSDPTRFTTMQAEARPVSEEMIDGDLYGNAHEVYREIAAALRGEKAFSVGPEDAVELSRMLDAIRDSDAKNEVVHL